MSRTYFFWDPLSDNILQERDESGTVTAEYTTEPGLYGNLISQNRGGVESQYHFDPQGSALALTDDNQQVTDSYAYAAFGEVMEHTGSVVNPFQYIGKKGYHNFGGTGISIMVRRRQLLFSLGRWLSQDPRHFQDGMNTFQYAHNRPNVSYDPSGQLTIEPLADTFSGWKCGLRIQTIGSVDWDFWLDKDGAPCNGYFVQQVTFLCAKDVLLCDNCIEVTKLPGKSVTYYEAFYVQEGANRYIGREPGDSPYTDRQTFVIEPDSCGIMLALGIVKFFCKDKDHPAANGIGTGDLGSDWDSDRSYGDVPCGIKVGSLPSTDVRPTWWGQPAVEIGGVEQTAFRFAGINYCCCKNAKKCPNCANTISAFAYPKK